MTTNNGKPIYLDYMATTPVDPRVASIMQHYLTRDGVFGNAGSETHVYGSAAADAIGHATQQVATFLNAQPEEIIWTSGATEANNLAIFGAARFYQRNGKHIITVITEHYAVLDCFAALENEGFQVTYLPVAADGLLDLAELQAALRSDTILVSVMHVNNEIGVIQNIPQIAAILKTRGIIFHTDAAQSGGKLALDVQQLGVDLLALSAHKMYGPKGVGVLYVKQRPKIRLQPLLYGGGQQHGLRSGTLPTHQIVAMGLACEIAQHELAQESARIKRLSGLLWDKLQVLPDIQLNGCTNARVVTNLNITIHGVEGASLLLALRELAMSTTSACMSARISTSHVLKALGLTRQQSNCSLRISLGRFTTEAEVLQAAKVIITQVTRLRALAP